jgi:hypothetical protein
MGPVKWAATSWAARFNLARFGPICSRALRIPGQVAIIWTAASLWILNSLLAAGRLRGWGFSGEAIGTGIAVALNLIADVGCAGLIAWAAGRFIFEARQSGELEMIMSTPVGAQEIVSGQWRAMKRLLLLPSLVMLNVTFVSGLAATAFENPWTVAVLHTLINTVSSFAFLLATVWMGMWLGSRLQKLPAAVAWTVGVVIGIPWLAASMACALVIGDGTGELTYTILNVTVSIGVGIFHWVLYRWARRKLEWEFSNYSKLSWLEFVERSSEDMNIAVQAV